MIAPPAKNKLQVAATELQPLREVGSMEKTQFWDIHEVMEALRLANRHGIPLNKLRMAAAPVRKAS
jgi:hypothetical protein